MAISADQTPSNGLRHTLVDTPGEPACTTTATIDFSIKPVLGKNNEISVLLAEGRDISDRIRAEDEKQHTSRNLRTTCG